MKRVESCGGRLERDVSTSCNEIVDAKKPRGGGEEGASESTAIRPFSLSLLACLIDETDPPASLAAPKIVKRSVVFLPEHFRSRNLLKRRCHSKIGLLLVDHKHISLHLSIYYMVGSIARTLLTPCSGVREDLAVPAEPSIPSHLSHLESCSFAPMGFSIIPLLVDPSSIDAKGVYAIKEKAEYIRKRQQPDPSSAENQSLDPLF